MSDIPYNKENDVYQIERTDEFLKWNFRQEGIVQQSIARRIAMITQGYFGDHKRFDGLIELRWKNGIRVYCFVHLKRVFVLLVGGNKNGQQRDIEKAKEIKARIVNQVRSMG